METKINIINIPILKDAQLQKTYTFNNDFRFEIGDDINVNCVIRVHIPVEAVKATEFGTSQEFKVNTINKSCYLRTKITDICYHINNNGVVHRIINVELANPDNKLLHTYISSERLAETIDFD